MTMIKEIGSEFHKVKPDFGHGFNFPAEGALVFSGRTAIETVLKELPDAKKAILPSYCCDSMIEPFRRAGIAVGFYSVEYKDGIVIEVQIPEDADIFLWCNYFGFHTLMGNMTVTETMTALKKRGGVIIEDITHSILSDYSYNHLSDYLVASIRKWEPISCGGYCAALNGKLHYIPTNTPVSEFIHVKTSAMKLKTEYFNDLDEEKKQEFLSMFSESNQWLSSNYSGLAIDEESRDYLANVDTEVQKEIRRRNARALYEGLQGKVEFLFPEKDMDCPLFVPIIVSNRDVVRKHLTANKIYCPVHWPQPDGCRSNLYNLELSLICDQRYDEDDMKRIVEILKQVV